MCVCGVKDLSTVDSVWDWVSQVCVSSLFDYSDLRRHHISLSNPALRVRVWRVAVHPAHNVRTASFQPM